MSLDAHGSSDGASRLLEDLGDWNKHVQSWGINEARYVGALHHDIASLLEAKDVMDYYDQHHELIPTEEDMDLAIQPYKDPRMSMEFVAVNQRSSLYMFMTQEIFETLCTELTPKLPWNSQSEQNVMTVGGQRFVIYPKIWVAMAIQIIKRLHCEIDKVSRARQEQEQQDREHADMIANVLRMVGSLHEFRNRPNPREEISSLLGPVGLESYDRVQRESKARMVSGTAERVAGVGASSASEALASQAKRLAGADLRPVSGAADPLEELVQAMSAMPATVRNESAISKRAVSGHHSSPDPLDELYDALSHPSQDGHGVPASYDPFATVVQESAKSQQQRVQADARAKALAAQKNYRDRLAAQTAERIRARQTQKTQQDARHIGLDISVPDYGSETPIA